MIIAHRPDLPDTAGMLAKVGMPWMIDSQDGADSIAAQLKSRKPGQRHIYWRWACNAWMSDNTPEEREKIWIDALLNGRIADEVIAPGVAQFKELAEAIGRIQPKVTLAGFVRKIKIDNLWANNEHGTPELWQGVNDAGEPIGILDRLLMSPRSRAKLASTITFLDPESPRGDQWASPWTTWPDGSKGRGPFVHPLTVQKSIYEAEVTLDARLAEAHATPAPSDPPILLTCEGVLNLELARRQKIEKATEDFKWACHNAADGLHYSARNGIGWWAGMHAIGSYVGGIVYDAMLRQLKPLIDAKLLDPNNFVNSAGGLSCGANNFGTTDYNGWPNASLPGRGSAQCFFPHAGGAASRAGMPDEFVHGELGFWCGFIQEVNVMRSSPKSQPCITDPGRYPGPDNPQWSHVHFTQEHFYWKFRAAFCTGSNIFYLWTDGDVWHPFRKEDGLRMLMAAHDDALRDHIKNGSPTILTPILLTDTSVDLGNGQSIQMTDFVDALRK